MRGNEYDLLVWGDFKTEVDKFLLTDADRLTDAGVFKGAMRDAAVRDLQEFIPGLRMGHEAIYCQSDFIEEGGASRAVLPPGEIKEITVINGYDPESPATSATSGPSIDRHPVDQVEFARLRELTAGLVSVSSGRALACIDPESYTIWLYPKIDTDMAVSVKWNGIREEWDDVDETPFGKDVALAVAHYIRSEFKDDLDEDDKQSARFRKKYQTERRKLWRRYRQRGQIPTS